MKSKINHKNKAILKGFLAGLIVLTVFSCVDANSLFVDASNAQISAIQNQNQASNIVANFVSTAQNPGQVQSTEQVQADKNNFAQNTFSFSNLSAKDVSLRIAREQAAKNIAVRSFTDNRAIAVRATPWEIYADRLAQGQNSAQEKTALAATPSFSPNKNEFAYSEKNTSTQILNINLVGIIRSPEFPLRC